MRTCAFVAGLWSVLVTCGCGGPEHPPAIDDGYRDPTPSSEGGGRNAPSTNGGGAGSDDPGGQAGSGSGPVPDAVIAGSALIAYFYDEKGIIIVNEGGVIHYDWDGKTLASYEAERPLLSGAYRDGVLMVADSGIIIALDSDLKSLFETEVVEACDEAVMLSGGRFVCGPSGDTDRVYYTYDATNGDLLATSSGYTYDGVPMLPIPGRDRFVTVTTNLSPTDYHMFEIGDEDTVTYVSDSPYHGDFPCSPRVGFVGNPATHLITQEGLMLAFMGPMCVEGGRDCFIKDGNLGTLPGESALYAGISNESDGEIFALVDPAMGSYYAANCVEGCILQRINLETRDVLFDRTTPTIEFDKDTIAQAYYLIPRPGNDAVWVIASGRDIYRTGYDDSLPYRMYLVATPAN